MENLLDELHSLLEKYNATIVRSASKSSELVICTIGRTGGEDGVKMEVEATFDEDISTSAIRHKWYVVDTYCGR